MLEAEGESRQLTRSRTKQHGIIAREGGTMHKSIVETGATSSESRIHRLWTEACGDPKYREPQFRELPSVKRQFDDVRPTSDTWCGALFDKPPSGQFSSISG